MAYSTPAMVRDAVMPTSNGTQTTNTNTAADLSDTQLQDAIAEADALIDAYIGKYYAVPVAVVITGSLDGDGAPVGAIPHPIDYWSRNIAAYNATLGVRGSQDFADTDPIARRYTATINALVAVSKGQANLQLPDNTNGPSATGAGTVNNPYIGNLFDPQDWNLRPTDPSWPLWPDLPNGWGNNW